MNQPDILHILKTCKTIAVVGLSPKVHRDSYEVAEYMQSQGYRIIPINPVAAASKTPILGETVYATLVEAAKVEKIDMVDCFRNSADIPPIATEAVQIKAQVLWMQLGIENEAAKTQATAACLAVVENRCLLIEHRRLKHLL
ncbi:MAG: CoA-binding protein [Burkholderiaceae bacterium]